MSRVFTLWLDSGANAFSSRDQEVSLKEIGLTDEEWDSMSEDQQEETMRDIAWDKMDWGFREVTKGE